VALGGSCTTLCGDSFGFVVDLTDDWQPHVVPWSSLTQAGWGTKATFDESQTTGIDFGLESGWVFDAFGDDSGFFFRCFGGLRAVMTMAPCVQA